GREHAFGRYTGAELSWRPSSWVSLATGFERGTDGGVEYLHKYSADVMLRPARAVTLRSSFLWNQAVGEMDELLGSAEWRLGITRIQAEAGRFHPHFDPDSIWNVFNSGPYDRAMLRIAHRVSDERELWLRYERRTYFGTRGQNAGSSEPPFRSSNDTASLGFGSTGSAGLRYAAE